MEILIGVLLGWVLGRASAPSRHGGGYTPAAPTHRPAGPPPPPAGGSGVSPRARIHGGKNMSEPTEPPVVLHWERTTRAGVEAHTTEYWTMAAAVGAAFAMYTDHIAAPGPIQMREGGPFVYTPADLRAAWLTYYARTRHARVVPALAGKALHPQPCGFTREDVDALDRPGRGFDSLDPERLVDLAARIAALLPPRE